MANSEITGLEELGLFTASPVKAGEFLGVFSGCIKRDETIEDLPPRLQDAVQEWAMGVGNAHSVCPLWPEDMRPPGERPAMQNRAVGPGSSVVDIWRDPMALANEPPAGQRANAYVEKGSLRQGGVLHHALILYAGRSGLDAHSEVLLHYGRGYAGHRARKAYRQGKLCLMPIKTSPSTTEIIRRILQAGKRTEDTLFVAPEEETDGEASDDGAYIARSGQARQHKRELPLRGASAAAAVAASATPPHAAASHAATPEGVISRDN